MLERENLVLFVIDLAHQKGKEQHLSGRITTASFQKNS